MFFLPDALSILTATHNWVAWRLENVAGRDKPAKVPYNPNTGDKAQSNNPDSWGTYSDALTLADKFHGGIGFMFKKGCGYAGIDLDNVILQDGTIKPFAQEIVRAMNSYTEISPSGHGLHILFALNRPLTDFGTRNRNNELGAEIYDNGRYFTVTGNVYGDEKTIRDCTQVLGEIYRRYWPKNTESASTHNTVGNSDSWRFRPDSELLERMFHSQHGLEIKRLYEGDISGYPSQSEAELALCNHFAFWTHKDSARIDLLFRTSALMRPKWDETHGNSTYGEMTIEKAIRTASERSQNYQQDKSYSYDKNSHTEGVKSHSEHSEQNTSNSNIHVDTLDEYIKNAFQRDIKIFKTFSDSTTGFKNLDDDNIRLYPALYAVGGIPSVGKTTFCLQLADNIAANGKHVIYFTLEQSKFDVVSKGIARKAAQITNSHYVTAIKIRNGFQDDYVKKALSEYTDIAANQVIIEGQFNISVSDILRTVENFINTTGHKPVVFVDYLQALSNEGRNNSTKEAIDFNVQSLKSLSTQLNTPVFVVSSFNRTNYLNIADFESFKESGGIEYTSDVVMALQLLAMNAQVFDKQNHLQAKRKFVQMAKSSTPRKIELITLKNRFGKSSARYFFDYYPAYELFVPYMKSEQEVDDEINEAAMKFQENGQDKGAEKVTHL